MRLLLLYIILCFISCGSPLKNEFSFWETQKVNFKYQNKVEFVSDSVLQANYKTFQKSWHSLFGGIIYNPVYLYAWQSRDKTKNEFTVIKDDGEHGLKILYFIIDKNDNLISRTQVAGKGSEAGYWFETRSKFINKDTLLQIGAITQWLDFDKGQKMEKTKGDTIFSYIVIDSIGKMKEKVFKEAKDLHFEKEYEN